MFVVRTTPADGDPRFLAFSGREDAVQWFDNTIGVAAQEKIGASVSLFDVLAVDDPALAIQAVRDGRAIILRNEDASNIL